MSTINEHNYIVRSFGAGKGRDWYLVKYANRSPANIVLGNLYLPERFAGKKIRFKVEIIEDLVDDKL